MDIKNVDAFYHGILRTKKVNGGVKLYRFTEDEIGFYSVSDARRIRAESGAGESVQLVTDAREIAIEFDVIGMARKRHEGEGAGAVAIARVGRQGGQGVHAHVHEALARRAGDVAHAELFEHVGELVAEEQGHDGGRGFVAAEAAVVGSGAHRSAQEARMAVQGADDRAQEDEELGVLVRIVAGSEEVAHLGAADGVVQVLARAVDAVEGFFVQQAGHTVTARRLAEHGHDELVMVAGEVAQLLTLLSFRFPPHLENEHHL